MPAPSVRNHLAALIDAILPTISGSPNRVIRLEGDLVVVGTDRSPTGEPVPLADIQAAADRVFDGEEVLINTASVGLRSEFVGAVLRSMSGVEVLQGPPRARLAEVAPPPDPEWEYDELVLSLDQYLRTNTYVESSDPEIVALSELLGRLPLDMGDVDRSPDAILQMLRRWRDIDLYYEEEPVPPLLGTPREKAVWERFLTKPDGDATDLDAAVASIRALADKPAERLLPVDDEAEAVEGRLLFRQHRARERDPEITRLKKAAAMERFGRLACEVCDFDFAAAYGQLGEGFLECHHRLPLATAGTRTTRLADLALVCPNCHRMLHRSSPPLTVEALKELIGR